MTAAEIDWVAKSELANASKTDGSCCGKYIDASNTSPYAGVPEDHSPMEITADQVSVTQGSASTFTGNVQAFKSNLHLSGDQLVYEDRDEIADISGNVIVRDKGLLLKGKTARIFTASASGKITEANYLMHASHARGSAAKLTRVNEKLAHLDEASYTTCEPADNAWTLTAGQLRIDEAKGVGTAKKTIVTVKDIPIFYFPYMTFPIGGERRTGILFPSLSSAQESGGLDMSLPIYLNIAPNWDATVTPGVIQRRGEMLELEARHLNRFSHWTVGHATIEDDITDTKRWLSNVEEDGKFGQYFWHKVNYTKVSDNNYLDDLNTTSLDVKRRSHLLQRGEVGARYQEWNAKLRFQGYQTIGAGLTSPYKLAPQTSLSRSASGKAFTLDWSARLQHTDFDTNSTARAQGQRLYSDAYLHYPMQWLAGYIKPSIWTKQVSYILDDDHRLINGDESPESNTQGVSIDSGIYLERQIARFGQGYTQSLIPRLYYLNNTYAEQTNQPNFDSGLPTFSYNQLFRNNRFNGYDRLADGEQASLGITSRWSNNATGIETLAASIGQIFYLSDREVALNNITVEDRYSQLAGSVSWKPNSRWSNSLSLISDKDAKRANQGNIRFRYRHTGVTANLSYRYQRHAEVNNVEQNTRQSTFSAAVPIADQWTMFAQTLYNHVQHDDTEQLFGFEYDNCCWQFRMIYQEGISTNNNANKRVYGVFFQFILKGLAGSSSQVDALLEDAISGYHATTHYE